MTKQESLTIAQCRPIEIAGLAVLTSGFFSPVIVITPTARCNLS